MAQGLRRLCETSNIAPVLAACDFWVAEYPTRGGETLVQSMQRIVAEVVLPLLQQAATSLSDLVRG